VRRGGALGYVQMVDRTEMYAAPLRRFAAEIMVAMAGHVATKLHLTEYWTGAGSDFSKVRQRIWMLYTYGYFGPPVRGIENTSGGGGIPPGADQLIERFWRTLEEQTEQLLVKHADEVEAIAQALLAHGELNNTDLLSILGDNGYRPNAPKLAAPRNGGTRVAPRITAPIPVPVAAAVAMEPAPVAPDLLKPLSEVPPRTVEGTQPNPAVRRTEARANGNGDQKPEDKKRE
jgi:hypothetical protein